MKLTITQDLSSEEMQSLVVSKISESEEFLEMFYFMSTIAQLQNMELIGEYITMPFGLEAIFHSLKDNGYEVGGERVRQIVEMSPVWTKKQQDNLVKFYRAYHSYQWSLPSLNE